ncbi:uncharacterized protein LOC125591926 [Brassica napus]|uniref:uncharacterized protein LOC125591926 n=1 Tax=Brassica napus TaxID=3708 RepID=UPI00207A0270|nr:uncharacterized protein LOC125591926 [Brassica napus]
MTFVYGDPVLDRRDQVWEHLTRFSTTRTGPWFMIGDFNEITCHEEKVGGRQRPASSFLAFKQMLNDCGMLEFPFTGDMLSWVGKRAGGSTVRCRLDRAVGNADWHEKFPHSSIKYMRLWGSDHRPILADILVKPMMRSKKFKFDKRWLDNEELRQVILEGWKSPDLPPDASIMEHISSCRKALGEWRRQHNINSAKLVEELKEKVEAMYADNNATTEEIAAALKELSEALKAEEMFWKQKSRIFESSNPEDIGEALTQVPTTITGAMNESLTAPVTEWEVKLALFAMHPEKAPGPDGMTALFYQKFWDIVKEDLTLMVNKFLVEGTVVNGLNDTNICLIPKMTKPNNMAQFRPISLCNVSYKIISKVLCQRLKKVLPGLISETQSAFVAGRQISDNIMIAQKMFHALRTKPSGRSKRMAIKTDMSKAYDRMEWSFIEAVMRKMGFSEIWITWIMRCITSRVNATTRQEVKDALGIQNEGGMGTYLGIPEDISGSKCKLFAFLKDKLMHRVNGWTGRWLSKGGKEVLIKSILLALPTYVMSTFLLPLEICENLASAIARFWWSSNPQKRGIHWAKWEKVCAPREEGGIGFRMIHEFNLALLAKQLWRLVQFPDSLVARVLRGRYYRLSSPLRVNSTNNPSYVWNSISAARKLLLLGIRLKIHSGYDVKVWEDPWIPTIPSRPAAPVAPVMHPNMRVSDLINQTSKEWDVRLLESYVNMDDIQLIRSLAISSSHRRDSFCWSYTRNGQYTVKSGYWVARNLLKVEEEQEVLEPSITNLQAFAWKLKAPMKIRHLIWQLLTGHVAVTRNLARRNMRCDNYCPRCGELEESVTHAIFECPPALQVWSLSATPTGPEARNEKLFRGIDRDPLELVRYAESECRAWFEANEVIQPVPQGNNMVIPQVISLGNICLLDGSWIASANFSGCGWVWMDSRGKAQLMGLKNITRRESALHSEVEALQWAMENMLQHSTCQSFGTDCKDLIAMLEEPHAWPSFATELEKIETLRICFPEFSITHCYHLEGEN